MPRFCEQCGSSLSPNAAFCAGCGTQTGAASASSSSSGAAVKLAPAREEKLLFEQDGVTVSSSRFIVGGQTYAMSSIASVRATVFNPSKMWPILTILFGAWGICAFLFLREFGGVVVALGILVIGVLWFQSKKPIFSVRVNSASGETVAFSSRDEIIVGKIVNALNEAIVHRG